MTTWRHLRTFGQLPQPPRNQGYASSGFGPFFILINSNPASHPSVNTFHSPASLDHVQTPARLFFTTNSMMGKRLEDRQRQALPRCQVLYHVYDHNAWNRLDVLKSFCLCFGVSMRKSLVLRAVTMSYPWILLPCLSR